MAADADEPAAPEQKPAEPVAAAAAPALPALPAANSRTIDLAYLPPDADMFFVLRSSPTCGRHAGTVTGKDLSPESLASMQAEIGLTPTDVESITLAGSVSKVMIDAMSARLAAIEGRGPATGQSRCRRTARSSPCGPENRSTRRA